MRFSYSFFSVNPSAYFFSLSPPSTVKVFDPLTEGEGEMLGAQKWLAEHACFSTSSGVEIHLKLAVSKVVAKATTW